MAKNRLAKLTNRPVSTMAEAPRASKEQMEHERRYRAEEALRTITRAEEHKRDRALMKDVKSCAREQAKTLDCVLGRKK